MVLSKRALSAVGAAALLLAALPAHREIKIGITASGTGRGAVLGQPQLKAVDTLPTEIAGEKITYISLDDASDPSKAAQNARKLMLEDKVDVLIGSSLTPVTLPLIDMAAENETPLMSMAAAAALVEPMDDKRKWVFKVVPNDDLMAEAIMKYIADSGVKRLGYIGVSDGYGEGYYNEVVRLAPELGIDITTHEVYARNDASVTGQVLKVLATKPDAVFIASAGSPAVLPQKALRERGYKGPIFQTHGVASQAFIDLGGEAVEGAIFAGEAFTVAEDLPADSPFKAPTMEFITKYKEVTGEAPPIFAAHMYDSVRLLEAAIPKALEAGKPGTSEFRKALRSALEQSDGVYLNNGLSQITLDDHNGYDARSAFLIVVKDGKFRTTE